MRKKLPFLIIIFCLFNYQTLLACSCTPASDFCSTIMNREGEISKNVSIVRGIVVQNNHHELIFQMTDFLGGLLPMSKTLRIQGGDGGNCLLEIYCFNEGVELILAADYNKDHDTYSLTLCGVPYLVVKDEMVTGKISGKIKRTPYHQLGEVLSCQVINPTRLNQRVAVFPTITNDITTVIFHELHSNSIKVAWDLIGLDGRIIQSSPTLEYSISEKIPVDLSYLPNGVYLLRIRNEGKDFVTRRIVKAN